MSEHLSTGEAALLYCILCKVEDRYPTVEESLRYMAGSAKVDSSQSKEKDSDKKTEPNSEQLTFI